MPNTKSAMKAMRQNAKRRITNVNALESIRKAIKTVRKHVIAAKMDEAQKALGTAFAALDKAAKKNIIHKNNASRRKSRLAKLVGKK
jgi:small subunit ribosomal protein S20